MAKKIKSVKPLAIATETEKKLIAETVVEEETEEVWKMGQGAPVEVPKEKKGKPEPKSKEPAVYGA